MLQLAIGNKRYSSWSLRSWLALALTGAPFEEVMIWLDKPDTRARILAFSPSGRVPALRDGDLLVWDSLAIAEYLAERFPGAGLWPADPAERAVARAACAEMHAGFADLRRTLPMDLGLRREMTPLPPAVAADVERIVALWETCGARRSAAGDFLFGPPGMVDCFFAPVATRFRSYGVAVPPAAAAYRDILLGWPLFRLWEEAALAETESLGNP